MKQKSKQKLKIGIFGISGCAGCLLTIIYESVFREITQLVEIKSFPFIKEDKYKGEFDYCLIEGTVCSKKDIETLNELRKRSKFIVALGSCAHVGGVPSMKNFLNSEKTMKFVYPKINHLESTDPTPINKHIKVDFYLPECPPNKEEILEFFKFIASNRIPKIIPYEDPVCFECRKKGNACLLNENKLCLGPITLGGCNAICPTNKIGCYACRGPCKDANIKAYIDLLKEKGYNEDILHDKLRTFAGLEFAEKEKEVSTWLEK